MSGRIRKSHTDGQKKINLRDDKGWTDPHGIGSVMKMRRKL